MASTAPINRRWRVNKRQAAPYLFIAPAFALMTLFMFYPLGYAFRLSLYEWDILGTPRFIGFRNFATIPQDFAFLTSVKVTTLFAIMTVPLLVAGSLAIAILLNRKFRFRNGVRSIIFYPTITSLTAIGMIWKYMLNDEYGIVNYLLGQFGIPAQGWLTNPILALVSVTAVNIWVHLGYNMVLFLAGLQAISPEYYEAATIDGANKWGQFRWVTLPLLKPVTLFVVVLTTINAFKVFDLIYIMTQGGPGFSTTVIVMYIYRQAFEMFSMGEASAAAVILFAIIFALTLVQFRLFGERD